jgi:hypothetical protein
MLGKSKPWTTRRVVGLLDRLCEHVGIEGDRVAA